MACLCLFTRLYSNLFFNVIVFSMILKANSRCSSVQSLHLTWQRNTWEFKKMARQLKLSFNQKWLQPRHHLLVRISWAPSWSSRGVKTWNRKNVTEIVLLSSCNMVFGWLWSVCFLWHSSKCWTSQIGLRRLRLEVTKTLGQVRYQKLFHLGKGMPSANRVHSVNTTQWDLNSILGRLFSYVFFSISEL